MKVAILSESEADEAAVRILTDCILGTKTEPIDLSGSLRARGWPSVRNALGSIILFLHYNTYAEGLVVVVDSDKTLIHGRDHIDPIQFMDNCRFCALNVIIHQARARLKHIPGRQPIKTAIGLAVPMIEAWYLCGINPTVSESMWRECMRSGKFTCNKSSLKTEVYGTDRPPVHLSKAKAVEHASRLVSSIDLLESFFADGYGPLADELRSW